MLVVLASRFDQASARLAERWAAHGARLMTPDDLSKPGWRDLHASPSPGDATAIVSGERVRVGDIQGVLVRLPAVSVEELGHIVADDREYVAAEMTAFLASWLSRLRCPVLNRPTPLCLCGPFWRVEKWLHSAARLRVPVAPYRRHSSGAASLASTVSRQTTLQTAVVVGDRCLGIDDPSISRNALLIARSAGTGFLQLDFRGSQLVGVSIWPSLDSQDVSDQVLRYLLTRDKESEGS